MGINFCHQEPPRQSDMRFDPGFYDTHGGGGKRKMSFHQGGGSKKKIELNKEQVELRKAEKRWVRPAEAEAALAETEKETQVSLYVFLYI